MSSEELVLGRSEFVEHKEERKEERKAPTGMRSLLASMQPDPGVPVLYRTDEEFPETEEELKEVLARFITLGVVLEDTIAAIPKGCYPQVILKRTLAQVRATEGEVAGLIKRYDWEDNDA